MFLLPSLGRWAFGSQPIETKQRTQDLLDILWDIYVGKICL